jgi:hypothetical protein
MRNTMQVMRAKRVGTDAHPSPRPTLTMNVALLLLAVAVGCAGEPSDDSVASTHELQGNESPESFLLGEHSQALTNCVPAPHEVAVFQNTYRQGSCVYLDIGTYTNHTQIGLPSDTISSFIVGNLVSLKGSQHSDFFGEAIWDQGSRDTLGWWNDRISSIQVYPKRNRGFATLFQDPNFSGPIGAVVEFRTYNHSAETGMAPNRLSSFTLNEEVHGQMRITLCTGLNLTGFCEVFTDSQAYLGNLAIGDNTVRSLKLDSL